VIGVSGCITSYVALLAYRRRADVSITRMDWAFLAAALSTLPAAGRADRCAAEGAGGRGAGIHDGLNCASQENGALLSSSFATISKRFGKQSKAFTYSCRSCSLAGVSPPNLMRRTFILALLTLITGCAGPVANHSQHAGNEAASPDSYYLLPGTASPQATYSLAWGISNDSHVDWKRLENGDDAYLDSLLGDQGQNIRNYIVHKQSKQIVGTLRGVRYFNIGNRSENHGSLSAAWTSDEQLVLVLHGGKWTFQSFDAVTLRNGHLRRQTDIGKPMTTAIGKWLAQHYPAQYPSAKDKLVINLGHPAFKANNINFTADILAEIPKAEDGFTFEGKGTFKVQKHSNGSVSVSLVSIVAK